MFAEHVREYQRNVRGDSNSNSKRKKKILKITCTKRKLHKLSIWALKNE